MRKFLLAASAAVVALTVTPAANAAQFIVSGGTLLPVPGDNDFSADLAALSPSLTKELYGADLQLTGGPVYVEFTVAGSESAYNDTFSTDNGTTILLSENTPFTNWLSGGNATVSLTNFISVLFGGGVAAGPGSNSFAVFTKADGTIDPNTVYFGYDDGGAGPDSDYDDLIIKATIQPVPEPATWALMVAGIAAVGVSMRRRARNVRVAFS